MCILICWTSLTLQFLHKRLNPAWKAKKERFDYFRNAPQESVDLHWFCWTSRWKMHYSVLWCTNAKNFVGHLLDFWYLCCTPNPHHTQHFLLKFWIVNLLITHVFFLSFPRFSRYIGKHPWRSHSAQCVRPDTPFSIRSQHRRLLWSVSPP